jgi:hypothetical protein
MSALPSFGLKATAAGQGFLTCKQERVVRDIHDCELLFFMFAGS